jgi:hypothetical protein
MKPESRARLKNRLWFALSWLLPALLIKQFILPDFQVLRYYSVPDDLYCMYWNTVHVKNAIVEHSGLFSTQSVLAPQGVSLLGHTYTPFFGLLHVFFHNAVFSINLAVYLHLLVFAAGVYALTALWLQSPVNRLIVSVLAVFNGYLLAKSGIHLNLLLIGLVPWNILLFLRAFDDRAKLIKPTLLMVATGTLLLNILFDYYAILYTLVFVFLWFVYQRFIQGNSLKMNRKKWFLAAIGLIVCHFLSRLLSLHGWDVKGGIWEAPDFRAFFVPGPLGYWNASLGQYPHSPSTENFVYAGISLLLLLCTAVFLYLRSRIKSEGAGLWLFLLIGFFCLVFPAVKIGGRNLFYLPNSLLHYIPFLQHFRSTGRMFEFFITASVVFSFIVIEKRPWKNQIVNIAVPLVFACIFIFEHYTRPHNIIAGKAFLPQEQDSVQLKGRTVLTLPWGIRDGFKALGNYEISDMKLISVPGCRVCSGYISRIPQQNLNYYSRCEWSQRTLRLQSHTHCSKQDALNWAKAVHQSKITAIRAAVLLNSFKAGFDELVNQYGWQKRESAGVIYLLRM